MNVELPTGQLLAYDRHGDTEGVPVVFLHGLSSSRRAWASAVQHLQPAIDNGGLRLFVVDQRGHGESSHATLETYVAPAYAADIAAFIDVVIGRPAIVVGHSLGGVVAACLATNHPGSVTALFLADPPYFEGDDDIRNASPVAAIFAKKVGTVRELQARNAPGSDYYPLLAPDVESADREWISETLRYWDPTTMQSSVEGIFWRGFDPLASLGVPHTIVHADPAVGAVFTPADGERVLQSNPQAHIVELTGASHLVLAPASRAAFLRELDTFLARHT
jgi:pimeloyl-ACP methyl ester carboxylesterase